MSELPESFELLLADSVHGSSVLVQGTAERLAALGELSETNYTSLARALLARRPEFALLHHLLHATGVACYEHNQTLAGALRDWLAAWQRARSNIRPPTFPLPAHATLVTWSHSGTLLAWVKELSRRHPDLLVHCALSVPGGEGEWFSAELVAASVQAGAVPDEAALDLAARCTLVATGADALFPGEFWNKAGTARLLAQAHQGGRPFLVVAESAKWCHPDWGLALGLTIEPIDNQLVSGFSTEQGELLPGQLSGRLPDPPFYAPLLKPAAR